MSERDDARELAEAAIRWLVAPSPGFGEYECGHGVPVISGPPCDEKNCPGHVVRRALAALRSRASRDEGTALTKFRKLGPFPSTVLATAEAPERDAPAPAGDEAPAANNSKEGE